MKTLHCLRRFLALLLYTGGVTAFGQVPRIDSVTPNSAHIGTPITIIGANFSSTATDDIVYFGAVRATVTSASANSLTAIVPPGATFAPITVTVGGLTAYFRLPFGVTFESSGVIDETSFATSISFSSEPETPAWDGTEYFGIAPAIAIGDLDGDGKPDVVVANRTSRSISIFRNTTLAGGGITFAPKVDFSTPTDLDGPVAIAIADLDGDGMLDVVAVESIAGTVLVFRNNTTLGTGMISFDSSAPVRLNGGCGGMVANLAVGDLDGDGRPDIATGGLCGNLTILRNIGTVGTISGNSFDAPVSISLPGDVAVKGITMGDFDGDGALDMAIAKSYDGVDFFRNISNPGNIILEKAVYWSVVDFAANGLIDPVSQAIGDFNNDGHLDIVVAHDSWGNNPVSIFYNDSSNGGFVYEDLVGPIDASQIALSDTDGDGRLDIFAVVNGGIVVLQNLSDGLHSANFEDAAAPGAAWSLAVGDLDGDGQPDFVAGHLNGGTISVYRNTVAPCTPPTLVSASSEQGSPIIVLFDKAITPASSQNVANYSVNGGAIAITSATLNSDGRSVALAVSGIAAVPETPFTVVASRIQSPCTEGNVDGGGTVSGVVSPGCSDFFTARSPDGHRIYLSFCRAIPSDLAQDPMTYSVNNGTVTVNSATWDEAMNAVTLTVTGLSSVPNTTFVVSVSGIENPSTQPLIIGGAAIGIVEPSLQILHSFGDENDGNDPQAGLVQGADGALYGSTVYGPVKDSSPYGTLFKVYPNGSGYLLLKSFSDTEGGYPSTPLAVAPDGSLFGTAGTLALFDPSNFYGQGPVFKLNRDGGEFTIIKRFTEATEGRGLPEFCGPVVGSDGFLYGTTLVDGSGGAGTVFQLNQNGASLSVLYNFASDATDGKGGIVDATLMEGKDGVLYGTALGAFYHGQPDTSRGSVFKVNRDGTEFSVVRRFSGSDGAFPFAAVLQGADGALYGTTSRGGTRGLGTIFKVFPDGSGFVVLKHFDTRDGVEPTAGLVVGFDHGLYGCTESGGMFGFGTIFRLNQDGTGFRVVKDFEFDVSRHDGNRPQSGALVSGIDGAIYGTTQSGGDFGAGTVFRLNIPLSASVASVNPAVVIANSSGFSLTLNGSQFQTGAKVLWNGQQLNTTILGATLLSADVPASDLLSSAEISTATVTVINPGGEASNPLIFTIVSSEVGELQSVSLGAGQSTTVATPNLAGGLTQAAQAGLAATINNSGTPNPIVATAATFTRDPAAGSVIDVGGGYVDLKLTGADAADTATVNFYYPTTLTGAAENAVALLYYTGTTWTPVLSSGGVPPTKNTANGLDGTTSGGRFTVQFDNTSTPKITELTGTIFGIAIAMPSLPNISCPDTILTNTLPGQYYGVVHYLSRVSSSDADATLICGAPEAILTNCVFASAVFPGNEAAYVFAKGRTVVTCGATKPTLGIITTVAGNGSAAFGGDNGPATAAKLNFPVGIATDNLGNVFIADAANNRIRRWDATSGTITTVAGNGTAGFSGDGGAATNASLNDPNGVAVDSHGNVYIADYLNLRVRKVMASSGVIATVAGTGTFGFSGDGGPATSANIGHPVSLAIDRDDNLYFSNGEGANSRVRKVSAQGIITTVAGSGPQGFSGDGGAAIVAQLNSPEGLAVDGAGNLFIADVGNERVRRVDAATGVITTVAGNGVRGFGGDGGLATSASLARAVGVRVDASGNLFIADSYNGMIRRVDAASGIISTVDGAGGTFATAAGNNSRGHFGFGGDGGSPMDAELNSPGDLAFNASGNLFIADAGNHRIRRVDVPMPVTASCSFVVDVRDTENPTVVCPANILTATVPGQCAAIVNYPAATVRDNCPNAIVTCNPPSGAVFAVGTSPVTCVAMDAAAGVVTTVIGNGVQGYSGDGSLAQNASIGLLSNPLAVDSAGNIFLGDSANHRIRRVDALTGVITTIAGNGSTTLSGLGGPAIAAGLLAASPLALDAAGNLFVGSGKQVLRMPATGGTIDLYAGTGGINSSGDGGPAINASIGVVSALAVDSSGNLLILDSFNGLVRKVTAATQTISTVAGNGIRGFSGDGGPATSASMNDPEGIAVDRFGNIFINDNSNQRIRRVDAATGTIRTVAGITTAPPSACVVTDIPATNAWLHLFNGNPAVDNAGNLFFNANGGGLIRRVDAVSGIVTTIAGTDSTGFNGDGSPADTVQFSADGGVALDNHGDLLVVDRLNYRVRRISFAGAAMGNTSTCSFTVTVQATPGITTLSPAFAPAGGPGFTLTVNGTCFAPGAVVQWNGQPQTTTLVSSSQLQATVAASNLVSTPDLATATITVLNVNGIASNPQLFTITSSSIGVVQSAIVPSNQTITVSSPNIATPLTQVGQAAVSASISNAGSPTSIAASAATFTGNPTTSPIIDVGGGYVDLKVVGADASDATTAKFYYPSTVTGAAESSVTLLYFTGSIWAPVLSSGGVSPVKNTTDNLDGTTSGGRFLVQFDNSSTPKLTDLSGTVFTVSIPDTTPPVVQCPANLVANTDLGQCSTAVTYSVIATDNSGAAKVSCNPPSGSRFTKGVTAVICNATDGSGNASTCSFTVTVNDTEPPRISCPVNLVVSSLADVPAPNPASVAASDNCSAVNVAWLGDTAPTDGICGGTIQRTYVATDASGNQASCVQSIVVEPQLIYSDEHVAIHFHNLTPAGATAQNPGYSKADLHGFIDFCDPGQFSDDILSSLAANQVGVHVKAVLSGVVIADSSFNLAVSGDQRQIWEAVLGGSSPVVSLKIHWSGALRFASQNSNPRSPGISSKFIGLSQSDLRFEAVSGSYTTAFPNGVSVIVANGKITSVTGLSATAYEIRSGQTKVDLDLPYRLVPGMVIKSTGSVSDTITVAANVNYTTEEAKYELRLQANGLSQTPLFNGSPATLQYELTLGAATGEHATFGRSVIGTGSCVWSPGQTNHKLFNDDSTD